MCDGGRTLRSRKGTLVDRAVQQTKRKAGEKGLDYVVLEGQQIENVYTFDYLGSRLQCNGDDKADVGHRMSIAQSVLSSLSQTDHRLPLSMKLRLYWSDVCSTFKHVFEAWILSDNVKRTSNGFYSRCIQCILYISSQIWTTA